MKQSDKKFTIVDERLQINKNPKIEVWDNLKKELIIIPEKYHTKFIYFIGGLSGEREICKIQQHDLMKKRYIIKFYLSNKLISFKEFYELICKATK